MSSSSFGPACPLHCSLSRWTDPPRPTPCVVFCCYSSCLLLIPVPQAAAVALGPVQGDAAAQALSPALVEEVFELPPAAAVPRVGPPPASRAPALVYLPPVGAIAAAAVLVVAPLAPPPLGGGTEGMVGLPRPATRALRVASPVLGLVVPAAVAVAGVTAAVTVVVLARALASRALGVVAAAAADGRALGARALPRAGARAVPLPALVPGVGARAVAAVEGGARAAGGVAVALPPAV